ncbi:ATP-binding protein [Miniimonas sp. S16]|uniref:ATP-binding protein n=1 Tax=Miniimonas sp. S16 TaxID=2171623 RepID=UPI00131F3D32|nr:ATP-binding protein [Miniimonas sp. S16]
MGIDAITGWPVYHDVYQAYQDRSDFQSPNVIVVGDIGNGKSSLCKTWGVLRQLLLGRRVVVIDKKLQEGQGEYAPLARALGVEPIRFRRGGGGTRINVLDPMIATEGGQDEVGQTDLLYAVMAEALGRSVKTVERKAVRVAHASAIAHARAEGRVATIRDVATWLLDPDTSVQHAGVLEGELLTWGRECGFALEELIEGDLAGLIDGETSQDISLENGLTVFDISALPEEGPAIPIVMAIISTWMRARWMSDPEPVPTVIVIEEGWHLVGGKFAEVTRRNMRLSRGAGLQHVTALHHLSDVVRDPHAVAVVQDAATVIIYQQAKRGDAEDCVRMFGLPESAVDVIQNLPQGTFLLRIGTGVPVMVSHVRSQIERSLTDTDGAMTSSATVQVSSSLRQQAAAMIEGAAR